MKSKKRIRNKLESMPKDELMTLARTLNCTGVSGLNKQPLVEMLISERLDQVRKEIFPPAGGWWEKYHNHFYGWASVLGLAFAIGGLAFSGGFDPNTKKEWEPSYTSARPTILAIYPKDTFGPLRQEALQLYFRELFPEIAVIPLNLVSTADMKARNIVPLLVEIKRLLAEADSNVLAIVGPPITECTESVLEAVANSKKQVPVFVESAGAPNRIGWTKFADTIPIFRLNSGIDLRGKEIAALLGECMDAKIPVHFFVESRMSAFPTYGEQLQESVQANFTDWNRLVSTGDINVHAFPFNDSQSKFGEFRDIASKHALIVICGLGHHYMEFAKAYKVKTDQPKPHAAVVGWMSAYKSDVEFRKEEYYFERLFEITDVDFTTPWEDSIEKNAFRKANGELSPASRDQAYSFDAGYCISIAYKATKDTFCKEKDLYPLIDKQFTDHCVEHLRNEVFHGVTGVIQFGAAGQNVGGKIDYCVFDSEANEWRRVEYSRLMASGKIE